MRSDRESIGVLPSSVEMVEHHERELQRPGPVEANVAVARGAVLGWRARAAAPIALVVLRAPSKPVLFADFPTKPQKKKAGFTVLNLLMVKREEVKAIYHSRKRRSIPFG